LWKGDKLLVYGGENEHRAYLSDIIIFDLKTATWRQPELFGDAPRGRARHAAVIHDEKLWISGGTTGHEQNVLEEIFYLDLNTWTWSPVWKFVARYDHTCWVWGGRIWVFGGMGGTMERTNEIWWIDFRSSTSGSNMSSGRVPEITESARRSGAWRASTLRNGTSSALSTTSSTLAASSSESLFKPSGVNMGSVSMQRFVSGLHLPQQSVGNHFHVYTSGYLLDFVTPPLTLTNMSGGTSLFETSLFALDLETLRWHKLADGRDLFNANYRWYYCTLNEDGTQTWLLGCPPDSSISRAEMTEDLLSDVLHIDLSKLGVLGNKLHGESNRMSIGGPTSDTVVSSPLSAIGADFARLFDQPPESGSGTDFVVVAEADSDDDEQHADGDDDEGSDDDYAHASKDPSLNSNKSTSKPIHVHRLILQARWPHFNRLWNSQMLEFHTKKLVLPEPYSTVRAFLYYLYSDSISVCPTSSGTSTFQPSLTAVAGMLVMANLYDMPRLRALCVNRLGKDMDVYSAATVWERANRAGEDALRRKAARFCMANWGRIVRTDAFRKLSRRGLVELCEEVDEEGRVMGGEELEVVAAGSPLGSATLNKFPTGMVVVTTPGGSGRSSGLGGVGSAVYGGRRMDVDGEEEDDVDEVDMEVG
jgi:BTB/POZ domain/Kelch motif/Galactose oxidase, central domain